MPADFIAVAEDSQVMVPLGEWILAEACGQLRRWRDRGVAVGSMSVNLSARQFQQRNLPDTVDRALASSGLSAESLHLEITESAAMKNLDLSVRTLEALRERRVRVLMDDFGSGHASIGYLRRFPLDGLKIDRYFVSRIESSPADAAMARAIIEMAHGLGMTVVAEGVESPGQLAFLRAHGCDEFQGYLARAPSAPAALEEFLAD